MQWSPDRNAGFSSADPARLFFPVIMDPVYGYASVNVEAQERNPSSFLSFMRRIMSLRRQYKAFGRGSFEFLQPTNKRVLAYLRRSQDEVILCVVNLSRFSQPCELDLSEFNGWIPMEIFGRTEFPAIGDLPYFLTLAPHGFYWFRLEPEPQPIRLAPSGVTVAQEDPPTIMIDSATVELFDQPHARLSFEEGLERFLVSRRWFQGKSRTIERVRIADYAKVGAGFYLTIVTVLYEGSVEERYVLPLRIATGAAAEALARDIPDSVVALVKSPREGGVIIDALADRHACVLLLSTIHNRRRLRTSLGGEIRGMGSRSLERLMRTKALTEQIKPMTAEQSNTSVVYDDSAILKLFRKIEIGVNPEVEIGRFLADQAGTAQVPTLMGSLSLVDEDGTEATLAVLQEFFVGVEEGWAYFSRQLRERRPAGGAPIPQHPFSMSGQDLPQEELRAAHGEMGDAAYLLGEQTAALHTALASDTRVSSFRPERLVLSDIERVMSRVSERTARVFDQLRLQQTDPEAWDEALIERVGDAAAAIDDVARATEKRLNAAVRGGGFW
ncbi:MAG: alpha-glucosidase C-terminal domain-containing protein, partial [Bdellovibrionales bacterium]|nr:alpha-glucosidase C-terminal domain-containing protein [Bdellovibrionales bacterium]